MQLIHDPEAEWKKINEIWLAEQEKKDRKKKPRVEKSVEEEDDDDFEFVVDKFDDEDDFIPFEDEDEGENVSHAENAGHAGHDNLHGNSHTNHSIDDEFNPGDFFDDMDDERAFEALYN